MNRLLLALVFCVMAAPAMAACPSPLTGKDASGTTQNFGVTVDGSGNCYGNVALVDGTAAANKAAINGSGQIAIQAPPTLPLPSGAATSTNQATAAAQGSTTTGQTGHLSLGAVTTGAPTYTPATTNPISLDTAGNLRVNCTLGCSSSSAITGWAGSTIGTGTIQAFGASQATIGSGLVPAVNAYVTNASGDPCTGTKLTADFESTSSGGSIVAGTSTKITYICSVDIVTSAAANVSLIEGTGSSVCTGGTTAGVYFNTGVTAANGAAFAANGGISKGDGTGTVAKTATAANNLCVAFTTTNTPQVNVHVAYVQQ